MLAIFVTLVVTLKVGDSLVVSESLFFAFFQKFISCHRGLRRPGSRFPIPRQGHKRIFERSSGPRAPLPGPLRPPLPRAAEGGRRGGLSLTPRGEIRGGVQMAEIWPTHGPTAPTDTQTNIRKHRTGGGVPMGGGLEFNSWGIFLGFWAYYVDMGLFGPFVASRPAHRPGLGQPAALRCRGIPMQVRGSAIPAGGCRGRRPGI